MHVEARPSRARPVRRKTWIASLSLAMTHPPGEAVPSPVFEGGDENITPHGARVTSIAIVRSLTRA